ncbi:MAG: immunity 26/phosphotriesterase HocA family protein [Bacteroidota bacterium]|nr:immunity 26/phosphotriesterase HocA family protein [Bacteroidota bacterium]
MYELNNEQRRYFGLEPIEAHWDRVIFKGDQYRPESILYFEGDTIKRHIISTKTEYKEAHYNEQTRHREVLLPKTTRGKEQKLNASTFEKRSPIGVYLSVDEYGNLVIGSITSQISFYRRLWEKPVRKGQNPTDLIEEFIRNSPENHFEEIEKFKQQKRQNLKFKKGDYFCFKLNRTEFGFGRILMNIDKLRKTNILPLDHRLFSLMGKPVLVELFVFASPDKKVPINLLKTKDVMPVSVMMDNAFFYGEYEIFDHEPIPDEAYDFPMSFYFGEAFTGLQWGLIELEMDMQLFKKLASNELKQAVKENQFVNNSIGFAPAYDNFHILNALQGIEIDPEHWLWKEDLRNPKWQQIRNEILTIFKLNPAESYAENCKKLGILLPSEIAV